MTRRDQFYTVGHSTRTVAELAALLRGAGADLVVDVRTVPRSRTNPQYQRRHAPGGAGRLQIGYRHIRQLGGLRGRRKRSGPSRNGFWENGSFRNYADYASTPDFRAGLAESARSRP